MKKLIITLILTLLVVLFIYSYIANLSTYKVANKKKTYFIPEKYDDTVRIAYIGDSWAYLHGKHLCIIDSIIISRTGVQAQVRSVGVSGMTSKEIYESVFCNDSFKKIFLWKPKYCVIVAGINDSDLKLGKTFYCKNMQLLLDFMIENNIIPVILEIPHYDIKGSYQKRYKRQKLSRIISMFITLSGLDCIDSYRNAFENSIKQIPSELIYIKEKEWCPRGYKDPRGIYVEDMMHLNSKGYEILDSCIASHISEDIIMKN